ncbi:hypothetical protein J416_09024 [Gracilibacillus halophilus YIM-C55.5]|uniref:Probable membrane transporter protein n=1 Tax=Gracilibacillus halophilus YIM-C55.5 TaxID=1308866 RepID=N4W966_9BACI|nr:hypothetical protein J416_09024 [Gracilibacillus halophilus YIM-C55.5]
MLIIFVLFLFRKKDSNLPKDSRQGVIAKKVSFLTITRVKELNNETHTYTFATYAAVLIGLIVGILSGFFGIGGGSLMVPAMILFFAFPPHIATATSMFIILSLSIVSSFTHIFLGHIVWKYVWAFIPGAWFGGTLGAKVNQQLQSKTIERFLRVILLFIGLRLIWQGVM